MFLTLSTIIASSAQTEILSDSTNVEKEESVEIIDPIETPAVFPGGQDSLTAYLERNNRWKAGQETISGKVFVEFVVETDGSVTNVKIMRGLCESCDAEALRLVENMPKWKPAGFQERPLRMKFILPITFNGLEN